MISFRARSALSSRGVLIRAEIFAKLDASHLKQLAKISYSDIVFTKCIRLIATRNNYTSCPRRGRLWQQERNEHFYELDCIERVWYYILQTSVLKRNYRNVSASWIKILGTISRQHLVNAPSE